MIYVLTAALAFLLGILVGRYKPQTPAATEGISEAHFAYRAAYHILLKGHADATEAERIICKAWAYTCEPWCDPKTKPCYGCQVRRGLRDVIS